MQHYQVSLPTSGTAVNVLAAIKASNPNFKDNPVNIVAQADKGNSTNNVYLGGPGVTTTVYGNRLSSANSSLIFPGQNSVANLWAVGDANTLLLNLFLSP